MGFGNQVSGQIGKTGNSISSWFGKANGAGDNASGGNGTGGGNNAGGENSGSQLQAPTVSVTGMDVVGERVIAKVSNLPEGANQVSYQWQYSPTKTGTFSDIEYGGNKNSYEISEEDEDYYLRCKVTTSSRAISPTLQKCQYPRSRHIPSPTSISFHGRGHFLQYEVVESYKRYSKKGLIQ